MQRGDFREDLYYRLRVLPIEMPPLRDRSEDIPLLAEHLLERVCKETGKSVRGFTKAAIGALVGYRWPGNVRELENEIRRATALVDEQGEITPDRFTERVGGRMESGEEAAKGGTLKARIGAMEKRIIVDALAECDGNISRAAEQLGLSRTGLFNKMTRYGLRSAMRSRGT